MGVYLRTPARCTYVTLTDLFVTFSFIHDVEIEYQRFTVLPARFVYDVLCDRDCHPVHDDVMDCCIDDGPDAGAVVTGDFNCARIGKRFQKLKDSFQVVSV